jgi:hypothetical protein
VYTTHILLLLLCRFVWNWSSPGPIYCRFTRNRATQHSWCDPPNGSFWSLVTCRVYPLLLLFFLVYRKRHYTTQPNGRRFEIKEANNLNKNIHTSESPLYSFNPGSREISQLTRSQFMLDVWWPYLCDVRINMFQTDKRKKVVVSQIRFPLTI